MKTCPYCAEEIQGAAIRCRYCGSDVQGTGGAGVALAPEVQGLRAAPQAPASVRHPEAPATIAGQRPLRPARGRRLLIALTAITLSFALAFVPGLMVPPYVLLLGVVGFALCMTGGSPLGRIFIALIGAVMIGLPGANFAQRRAATESDRAMAQQRATFLQSQVARQDRERNARLQASARAAAAFPSTRVQMTNDVDRLEDLVNRKSRDEARATLQRIDAAFTPLLTSPIATAPEIVALRTRIEQQRSRLDAQERADAEIASHPVVVVKSTWRKAGFNDIAMWTVTLQNRSDRPVGNITYRTTYSSETGTVVDRGGVDAVLGGEAIAKAIRGGTSRTVEVNDGFLRHDAVHAHFELVSWEFLDVSTPADAPMGSPSRDAAESSRRHALGDAIAMVSSRGAPLSVDSLQSAVPQACRALFRQSVTDVTLVNLVIDRMASELSDAEVHRIRDGIANALKATRGVATDAEKQRAVVYASSPDSKKFAAAFTSAMTAATSTIEATRDRVLQDCRARHLIE